MKKLIWPAALLLVFALLFPNGISVRLPTPPAPVPAPEPAPAPVAQKDAKIVELLTSAPREDKARIAGMYLGMLDVIKRDAGKLMRTTEQFSVLQTRTLVMALDGTELKGKYPGLDVAIEAVFNRKMRELDPEGKRDPLDVVTADEATRTKLMEACQLIADSAQ